MQRLFRYTLLGMACALAGQSRLVRADEPMYAPAPAGTVVVPAPAPADTVLVPSPAATTYPTLTYQNGYPAFPAGAAFAPAAGSDWVEVPDQHERRKCRPIYNFFHDQKVCCWAGVNTVGCGSLHAELDFIFGSCRHFYGEPCYKGPPPLLLPQGYAPAYGAGAGTGSRGCACP
jgi:hypothetical protein